MADNIGISQEDNTKNYLNSDFINNTARIAVYNDFRSAPRVVEVKPSSIEIYIENIASNVYTLAQNLGGTIPYTVIREVSENFIHANFAEVVVSIFDNGNTIRFADQGPGINSKETAKLPGFSSASEEMKKYIRGVGSGLPIVREYLEFSEGNITIDDNIKNGAVITISLINRNSSDIQQNNYKNKYNNFSQNKIEEAYSNQYQQFDNKNLQTNFNPNSIPVNKSTEVNKSYRHNTTYYLSEDQKSFLLYFLHEGYLGVTDLVNLSGRAQSSTYNILKKLEDLGYIEKGPSQKRVLTEKGQEIAMTL